MNESIGQNKWLTPPPPLPSILRFSYPLSKVLAIITKTLKKFQKISNFGNGSVKVQNGFFTSDILL